MKKAFVLMGLLVVATVAMAQEEQRVDVTSFEDLEGQYTGGSILGSIVEEVPLFEEEVTPQDGNAALYVEYDNTSGTWQWAQLNFPAVDATGMSELHMWAYWLPDSVPDADSGYGIRVELVTANGNINLGFQNTDVTGEWVELVWPIGSQAQSQIDQVSGFGGFISPQTTDLYGSLYIDNIYFVRPAGTTTLEEVPVFNFDEEDPFTTFSAGWISDDESAQPLFPGEGEVTPSEGTNYMTFPLTDGWASNIRTENAQDAFDRWDEVKEIWMDARVSATPTNWGPQSALIIQSDSGGWDQYPEVSYQNAVDDWQTLVWTVDMSPHAESIQNQDGSLIIRFSTNNDAANAGVIAYFDNFRVLVPSGSSVGEWSLY